MSYTRDAHCLKDLKEFPGLKKGLFVAMKTKARPEFLAPCQPGCCEHYHDSLLGALGPPMEGAPCYCAHFAEEKVGISEMLPLSEVTLANSRWG